MAKCGEEDGKGSGKRKKASPVSSSPQKSIKLKTSDVLDCPTCSEPLKSPIYQCKNGHVACSSCNVKLNKTCSYCKLRMGDIRCRAMERIIDETLVSCANVEYGCLESTVYGESSHEELCVFAPCSCVVPKCNYVGSYMDLKTHVRAEHSSDKYGLSEEFVFDDPLIFSVSLRNKKMDLVIIQEENEGDLVVVQAFKGPNGVYVTVSCIAPMSPEIRNLSCSIARLGQFTTLRLGLMMEKIQKVSEEMQFTDRFMFIPSYMLARDDFKLHICIGIEGKYLRI